MEILSFSYIEKVLSSYQFWLVILVVTSSLLFFPENIRENFGVLEISKAYKAYISLAFYVSGIVFTIKGIVLVLNAFKNFQTLKTSNLNDEERAILCFFIKNQFQGASFIENHPTIVSLKNRNFIQIPHFTIFVIGGDDFEYFVLTKAAEKKLKSAFFQHKLFENIDENKILDFVNSISRQQYSPHNPQSLN